MATTDNQGNEIINYFQIFRPSVQSILTLQERDKAYYWSGCVENFLRKYGIIPLCQETLGDNLSPAFAVVTREAPIGHNNWQQLGGMFEGPVHEEILNQLGIKFNYHQAEKLEIFRPEKNKYIKCSYSRFVVKQRLKDRETVSEPYPLVSDDSFFNNRVIRYQELIPHLGWQPSYYALVEDREIIIGVTNGKHLILGFPVFDLACNQMVMPDMDVGYYSKTHSSHFELDQLIIDDFLNYANNSNVRVVGTIRWPGDKKFALTIRHDYDRLITDYELLNLLSFYNQHGVKCSWHTLVAKAPAHQLAILKNEGHEIALHTVAYSKEVFSSEVSQLNELGFRVRGGSAHGGMGSPGFLGNTQFNWSINCDFDYFEKNPANIKPHAIISVAKGYPQTGKLILHATHISLDGYKNMNDILSDGILSDSYAKFVFEMGEHINLMNHPDLNRSELFSVIESLDLSQAWCATSLEVVQWVKAARYSGYIQFDRGRLILKFERPLPLKTDVYIGFSDYMLSSDDFLKIGCKPDTQEYVLS